MHGRGNRKVSDGEIVSGQPPCLGELGIEYGGLPMPLWRVSIDDGLVGLSLEQSLDDEFHNVYVAAGVPEGTASD